jgi:hypothetical protein
MEAGQTGHQASVIIGYGRLAAIWLARRQPGAWRTAATSPRVAPARRSSAGRGGHQCGQYERDQREDDDDAVKHLRVHGASDLVAVRENPERALTGMALHR